MCGIFGYIGNKNASQICIDGLRTLEYRGYDSAGLAGVSTQGISSLKAVGTLDNLENLLKKTPLDLQASIAHTRWATHGKACIENAHPHFDQEHSLAIVHNGIIENYREIKTFLIAKGIHFYSDTDSEVIAKLISYNYKGDFLAAVALTLEELKGLWAIACIHKDHPEMMVIATHDMPLACAFSKDEVFISSDANAFQQPYDKLYFLKSGQLAKIEKGSLQAFDYGLNPKDAEEEKISVQNRMLTKAGFEHFMQKEIFEQPFSLEATLKDRITPDGIHLPEIYNLEPFLKTISRVVFVGCGTSWHAGLQAALFLEKTTSIPSSALIASELRYNHIKYPKDTLFVAISQSGETMDTISAIKDLKAKGHEIICLTNVPNSSLQKTASCTMHLHAGPEISVCSTKAFTSQLSLAYCLVLKIAELKKIDVPPLFFEKFLELPRLAQEVLAQNEAIKKVAKKLANFQEFFFLGRQDMHVTALESALKLKEISYAQAQAYPAGEMKHGPIALVGENLITVALLGHVGTLDKMQSNLMEIHARSGPLVIFCPPGIEGLEELTHDIIIMPTTLDSLAPIPYSIGCQLLAYYTAYFKGCSIDKPKNLAKSVTVE